MNDQPMAQFLEACGATGPLQLQVEAPGQPEPVRRLLPQPFAVVGRNPEADLPLDDARVSQRHAYLQVIAGRLFCVDLQSRTGVSWGRRPLRSGWLERDRAVGIGPFRVRLVDST